MEDLNPKEFITITNRAKTCLMRYLFHFIKLNDHAKIIRPNQITIDIFSTSEKSFINKIYYQILIRNNNYNPKIDLKKNSLLYEKMKSFYYPLKDECNNKIGESEISIKVDLAPFVQNKMVINFEFFNFFYYNGNIFHKFVIKPNIEDIADYKKKLFIFFHNFENKEEVNRLQADLNKIVANEKIWKIFSYIYIIIPVANKNKAIEIHNILPDFFKVKNDKNIKLSMIYLSDDIKDGGAINIFMNYYRKKNRNYFFFLNNKNEVSNINEYSKILKEIKSYIQYLYAKKDPVQTFANQENNKKSTILGLFVFLSNFINDICNKDYLFEFNYNMNFSIKLIDNYYYFQLNKVDKIEISGMLRTNDYINFKHFFDNINDENFIFNLKEIKTINIDIDFSQEMKCKVCKEIITQEKECYYCYICKDFYCYKCVKNNFETQKGRLKFIDLSHNLLFFKTRDKTNFTNIDVHKLGTNDFAKNDLFKNYHSASCDGCASSFYESQRFICLTCKPGMYLSGGYSDYCTNCIEHMMKNDIMGKKIQNDVKFINYSSNFLRNHILKEKHDHNSHVYLMVALEGAKSTYQGF